MAERGSFDAGPRSKGDLQLVEIFSRSGESTSRPRRGGGEPGGEGENSDCVPSAQRFTTW